MSYHPDSHNAPRDVPFKPAGIGMSIRWRCGGCNQNRFSTAGSRGKGLGKRCSVCVAAKQARAAA